MARMPRANLNPAAIADAGKCLNEISILDRSRLSYFDMPIVANIHPDDFTLLKLKADLTGSNISTDEFQRIAALFHCVGLLERWTPTCRVRAVEACGTEVLVATDSPVAGLPDRAYPWPDEGELIVDKVVRRWRELFPGQQPRTILDACCGAGTAGLLLARLFPEAKVYGIDSSARAVSYAAFNKHHSDAVQSQRDAPPQDPQGPLPGRELACLRRRPS